MNKAELIAKVAEKAGIRKKDAEAAVNAFVEVVTDALKSGDKVEIRGFGTFLMKERAARIGRNPQTGEKVKVPAKIVPAFKAGKELREATEKVKK
jgi:DNA-binding protein HU-beta